METNNPVMRLNFDKWKEYIFEVRWNTLIKWNLIWNFFFLAVKIKIEIKSVWALDE